MMYTVNTFQTLLESHPNATLDFLSSQDGGNFRVVGDSRFRVVRYDKKATDMSSPYVRWMRSTVWDTEANLPMCVSPPKAEKEEHPPSGNKQLLVQDFVDGTMINVVIPVQGTPFVVSRSQIGAGGNFYSQRSFAQLFDDAQKEQHFDLAKIASEVKDHFRSQKDVHSYFVSFVLQHPEHRVVSRIQTPRAYAISMGCVLKSASVVMEEVSHACASDFFKHMAVKDYPVVGFKEDQDSAAFMAALQKTAGWFWQGLTFKDTEGRRWRMRNSNYMTLRTLRGSEALPLDRWLRLRSKGLVMEYLKHYGEDRATFWNFEQGIRKLTNDVFDGYVQVHKAHTKKLTDYPKNISPCIFRLHAHYLEHLKSRGEVVRVNDAIELINNMSLLDQRRLMTPPRAAPAAATPEGAAAPVHDETPAA